MLEMSLDTNLYKRDALKVHLAHKDALPNAARYTLDEMAVKTWKTAKRDLSKNFTLRNTWTARSLGFQKVGPSNNIDQMESSAGSRAEYMREQQEGVNKTTKGKHGIAIPTTFASGEGGAGIRKKRVMRKHYLGRLRVAQGLYAQTKSKARNHRHHLSLLVSLAKKRRAKVIFWRTLGNKQGFFLIDKERLPMLYDLSERRITSKARPWLTDARDKVSPSLHKIYGKALRFQLYKAYK